MIRNLLLVALGGAAGSVLRYLLSGLNTSFPWGTFTVNVLGSLLIGLLVGMMKAGDVLLTALYVGASVVIGILAVWGGMMLSNISIRG